MGLVQDSLLALHLLTQPDTLLDHAHACRLLGGAAPRARARAAAAGGVVVHRAARGGARALLDGQAALLAAAAAPTPLRRAPRRGAAARAVGAARDATPTRRSSCARAAAVRRAAQGARRHRRGRHRRRARREHGGVACMRFMGDAQRLTHAFLLQRGHHVGIDDVMLSREGHARVAERLDKATRLCEEIQREACDAPADVAQAAEGAVMRLLSKTLLQTGGIVHEHMSEANAIRRMVTAGSKGSFINLSQICAALGQQSLEGGRIVAEKGTRTLPCFAHGDPRSRAAAWCTTRSRSASRRPSSSSTRSAGARGSSTPPSRRRRPGTCSAG